VILYDETKMT